jgi:hypothetical protein
MRPREIFRFLDATAVINPWPKSRKGLIVESIFNRAHLLQYHTMVRCCDCSTPAGAMSLVAVSIIEIVPWECRVHLKRADILFCCFPVIKMTGCSPHLWLGTKCGRHFFLSVCKYQLRTWCKCQWRFFCHGAVHSARARWVLLCGELGWLDGKSSILDQFPHELGPRLWHCRGLYWFHNNDYGVVSTLFRWRWKVH